MIDRYDRPGPRYTSYPTAAQFRERFGEEQYRQLTERSHTARPAPLSLYVHIPFCHSLCYYCGCTKKVANRRELGDAYLRRLRQEIVLQGALFDRARPVEQLHLGGGTPTWLTDSQLVDLMDALRQNFSFSADGRREFSIELDPRTMDTNRLEQLAAMGFNRLSLGVQDFDPTVQRAINRHQSVGQTLGLLEHARAIGFRSVSIDLIYGLPLQTTERFGPTLDTVLDARPDRIAAYSYAHLPQIFKSQRMIREMDLPSAAEKLDLLELTVDRLTSAGYVYIGMDHFALPGDELVQARHDRSLQRNFQGYSTHRYCDLVGLGMSAISSMADGYSQNFKTLPGYYAALDSDRLPVWRGIELNFDDRLRRDVIHSLMCHDGVEYDRIERQYDIEFDSYFADELTTLEEFVESELIDLDARTILVRPAGRYLLRAIAIVFDAYERAGRRPASYSKII